MRVLEKSSARRRTIKCAMALCLVISLTSGAAAQAVPGPDDDPCLILGSACDPLYEACAWSSDCVNAGVLDANSPGSDPAPAAVTYLMNSGYTEHEAWQVLDAQARLRFLRTIAADTFPATFAGAWIEHNGGASVHLGFTHEAELSTEAVFISEAEYAQAEGDGSAFPLPVVSANLSYSLAQLNAFKALVDARIPLVVVETNEDVFSTAVDETTNALHIRAEPRAAQRLRLMLEDSREIPEDAYRIEEWSAGPVSGRLPTHACVGAREDNQRGDCQPLRGGISITRIVSSTETAVCTLGFVTQPIGMFTAGHCGDGTWRHRGINIGDTTDRYTGSLLPLGAPPADVQFVALDNPYHSTLNTNGHGVSRWVYLRENAHAYAITSVYGANEFSAGMVFCKSGITSNETCGVVTNPSALVYLADEFQWFSDQIEVATCFDNGDSGSPLYTPEKVPANLANRPYVAAGIGSGYNPFNSCPTNIFEADAFDVSWFSKVAHAQRLSGAKVQTT